MSSSPSFSRSSEPPRLRRATSAVLHVLSGARAGVRYQLTSDFATLGRHPSSDLAFDPERDADVSTRHAAVFRQGPGYVVRDLGSTNGTWVNGARVRGDRALEPGDRIRLGTRGPEVEFVLVEVEERPVAATPESAPVMAVPSSTPTPVAPPSPPPRRRVIGQEESTTDLKIRVEVARQTDRLRRRLLTGVLLGLAGLVLAVSWLAWSAVQARRSLAQERQRLIDRVDSVDAVLRNAAERASGLKQVLDSARHEADVLRQNIAQQGTNSRAIRTLDSQVLSTIARHDPLLRAARFDATAISANNARSIVMVFVEKPDGERVSATGFVLRTNADTGWIVTSKHVVTGSAGEDPERIAVAFNGGKFVWRARLVSRHRSTDLALIRVLAWGQVFPVQALNLDATPQAGEPVAVLGFPHGLDIQDDNWRQQGLRVSTTAGTVSSVAPDRIQIDGYGAPGASGSPVFNAAGQVIGVLFGGQPESGGRLVYATPAAALKGWLAAEEPNN